VSPQGRCRANMRRAVLGQPFSDRRRGCRPHSAGALHPLPLSGACTGTESGRRGHINHTIAGTDINTCVSGHRGRTPHGSCRPVELCAVLGPFAGRPCLLIDRMGRQTAPPSHPSAATLRGKCTFVLRGGCEQLFRDETGGRGRPSSVRRAGDACWDAYPGLATPGARWPHRA
jgi:hypothetical protein